MSNCASDGPHSGSRPLAVPRTVHSAVPLLAIFNLSYGPSPSRLVCAALSTQKFELIFFSHNSFILTNLSTEYALFLPSVFLQSVHCFQLLLISYLYVLYLYVPVRLYLYIHICMYEHNNLFVPGENCPYLFIYLVCTSMHEILFITLYLISL